MAIRPVPKPPTPPRPPRAWNSSLPIASKYLAKATKPIPKENKERQSRTDANYRKGMAAYRKTETYKLVERRAGGLCEYETAMEGVRVRCDNSRRQGMRMHHHHVTYFRFGGEELPEDMQLLCDNHHRLVESLKPHKQGRPF